MRPHRIAFVFTLLPAFLLTGCALDTTAPPTIEANTPGALIQGIVHGGQQPVTGATVTLYSAGKSGYGASAGSTAMAHTTTNSAGSFAFGGSGATYTCTSSTTPMYIVAQGSSTSSPANANLTMIAMLGPCSAAQSATVDIDEVTTAAAVMAYGQFMNSTFGSSAEPMLIGGTCSSCATGTYTRGLVNAFYTYNQLVTNATGTANSSSTSGAVTITTESAKLNTIANILASCVNSSGETSTTETTTNCGKLFTDVYAGPSTRPYDTLQAALSMALYPTHNVSTVFGLASATSPFVGLSTQPNDWSIAIAYTTTAFGLGIQQYTSSNIDIDSSGNIWFPSNKTGAKGIVSFNPSTTTFTSAGGSALVYPQYVAVDASSPAFAWATDLSGASVIGVPTTTGTAKTLTSNFTTSGPVAIDAANDVVFSGLDSGTYYLYYIQPPRSTVVLNNSPSVEESPTGLGAATAYNEPFYAGSAQIAEDGPSLDCDADEYPYNYDTNVGTSTCSTGGAVDAATPTNTYQFAAAATANAMYDSSYGFFKSYIGLNLPEGIALDGAGNLWVANSGNASIAVLDYNAGAKLQTLSSAVVYLHNASNGNTLTTPYGIAVDGSGNVWASNAGCVATSSISCSASSFTLTELVGVAAPNIMPLALQGSNAGTEPTN